MKSGVQKLMQKFKNTDITIIEAAFVKVYLQKKNIFLKTADSYAAILKGSRTEMQSFTGISSTVFISAR